MLTMRSSDIQSDPQIWQTLPQGEQGNEKKMPWMPKRPSSWSMGGSSCCLAVVFLQARRAAAARAACQDRPWPCLTLLRCHSDGPALPEDSSDESSRSRSRSRSSTLSSLYGCLFFGCDLQRSQVGQSHRMILSEFALSAESTAGSVSKVSSSGLQAPSLKACEL